MDKPIILIVVDDEGARRSIAELLHGQGDAAGRSEVMACVHERAPDLVIVGSFRDATWDALEVAREVRKTDRMLPVMDSIHQPLHVERRTYASSRLRNLRALRMAGAAHRSQCTTNRG